MFRVSRIWRVLEVTIDNLFSQAVLQVLQRVRVDDSGQAQHGTRADQHGGRCPGTGTGHGQTPNGCELHCGPFPSFSGQSNMLAPKALLDALSDQASRLLSGDTPQPRAELESQFKVLMQGAFSKLDLVSREEFDNQMVVLARTRARLEALEKQVAELEARMAPTAQE